MHTYIFYPAVLRFFYITFIVCIGVPSYGQEPLPHAHAHNDYMHEKPLFDALANGFTSVEADVLLIDGELYVGHDMPKNNEQLPTLKEAYLVPLHQRVSYNGGKVYQGYDQPIFLMIDFKTDAEATYQVLRKQLEAFLPMLTITEHGVYKPGAITVFISGNRPTETVRQEPVQYVGIDGRPEDLDKNYPTSFMPVISQNFNLVTHWNGEEEISPEELNKIKKLVAAAHQQNKKVRLWAAPDHLLGWETLMKAGVDLINTDHLPELKDFLLENGH